MLPLSWQTQRHVRQHRVHYATLEKKRCRGILKKDNWNLLKKLDKKHGQLIVSNGVPKMETNSYFSLKTSTNCILKICTGWKATLTYNWMFLIFALLICACVLHWKSTEQTTLLLMIYNLVHHNVKDLMKIQKLYLLLNNWHWYSNSWMDKGTPFRC